MPGADVASDPAFSRLTHCWICGENQFCKYAEAVFEFSAYKRQDPELAEYTGKRVGLQRCLNCGFGQPEALPTLPNYFDRMYDQHWSEDWIENEFFSGYKDLIFQNVLAGLGKRNSVKGALLDIGAHVGRLIFLAAKHGWRAEGLELNPRTAAFAVRQTRLPIHRCNVQDFSSASRSFVAVTLIDVLEHIPNPLDILRAAHRLLEPGGWLVVKAPSGNAQWRKERLRGWLNKKYRPTLADNLVHINHFSPTSLCAALEKAGFCDVQLEPGAPEMPPLAMKSSLPLRLGRSAQKTFFQLGRFIPGAVFTPFALHLQAYARKP